MSLKKYILSFLLLLFCSNFVVAKKTEKSALSDSDRNKFLYYFYEAVRQREAGNYSESADLLNKCMKINNESDALHSEYAKMFQIVGDVKWATAHAFLAYSLAPDNYWQNQNVAELLLDNNYVKLAVEVLENSIKEFPKEENSYLVLVSIYEQNNMFEKAIEVMDKHEKTFGVQEEISLEKFKCYTYLNQPEKALKEVDKLIDENPNETRLKLLRAEILYDNGDIDEALKIIDEVLKKEPENGLALLKLAKHYESIGEKEKAIEMMDKTLRSSSLEFETKVEMLSDYLNSVQERSEWQTRILTLFESLENIHPDVADVHYYFASYYIAVQNYDAAIAQLQKAIDIDPQMKEYQYLKIELMLQQDSKDCVEAINSAKESFPEDAKFYYYEASYYYENDNEKAEDSLIKGIELAKTQKDAQMTSGLYAMLGDLYNSQKKTKEAFECYENGLSFSSSNTQILNNYSYELAERGEELEKAEKMVKLCLKLEPNNYNAIDTYAWVLFKQEYYHLAKQNIEKLLNDESLGKVTRQVIWEHYGDILSKLNDVENAVAAWQKSVELGNNSELIKTKIELKKYVEK